MKDIIEHQGTIESIKDDHVVVRIVQHAACGSCKAKSMCSSSESKEKLIDVYEAGAALRRHVGDNVSVCGTLSMGKKAVYLAFGVPLLITTVWMMLSIAVLGMAELAAVGILAGVISLYFFILYLNRNKMAKKFAFWIKG